MKLNIKKISQIMAICIFSGIFGLLEAAEEVKHDPLRGIIRAIEVDNRTGSPLTIEIKNRAGEGQMASMSTYELKPGKQSVSPARMIYFSALDSFGINTRKGLFEDFSLDFGGGNTAWIQSDMIDAKDKGKWTLIMEVTKDVESRNLKLKIYKAIEPKLEM